MGKGILISALAIFAFIAFIPACQSAPEVKTLAKFVVNKLEVSPKEIGADETVTVRAEITNIGGLADNYTAILYLDGIEKEKTIVSISCNETKIINWRLNSFGIGRHVVQLDSTADEFSTYIKKMEAKKENVPDNSYVQINNNAYYYEGTGGEYSTMMISVHNKHETWSLRDVKVIMLQNGQEYVIADLIKPYDTATFSKNKVLGTRFNVTWTWQPPSQSK